MNFTQFSFKIVWSIYFQEQRDVINCLVNGIKKSKKYPENVRKFCMRQQYYSMAAYKSLRLFFNNNIPAKRTLQMWYASVDGSPGICESSLAIIHEKAESYLAENHHRLHLTLIWDEMSIRKQLCWCAEKQTFIGFSTVNNISDNSSNEDSSQSKLAKDALVFLVVGSDFKIPVAYELLNGLESINRAAIILQVIKCIEKAGAVVISLTGDGLAANLTTYETLGVKFDEGKSYFQSPTYPVQKIYIIFDPPHMLKLVRKHFSTNMIYYQNQLVNWGLLDLLVEKQSKDNFNLCNKLTKLHMNWHQKPMNVKLAAQTISKSVADTLKQLRKDAYTQFKDSETTEKFLQYFNDGFDILNFRENSKSDGRYKQKLCEDTANNIFEFAEHFKQFILQLEFRNKTTSKPILLSSAEKGFFGFYTDYNSLQGIYQDFVLNGPLKEFYTFQFSQDHLETFFSLIRCVCRIHHIELHVIEISCFLHLFYFRNSLGRNDNPNAIEFASAFKKLLVCHPVMTSVDHNVITNATGILTISSSNKEKKLLTSAAMDQAEVVELELCYEAVMIDEIAEAEPYEQHMFAYIALCVEEKFIQNTKQHKYKCNKCADVLLSVNDKINDEFLSMKDKNVGEIQQPSASTLKIVIFGNAVNKLHSANGGNKFNIICNTIFNNIDVNDLYESVDFSDHEQKESGRHKEEFIILIIKTYMALKSHKISKKITDEEKGELIRYRKKRDYILSGQ